MAPQWAEALLRLTLRGGSVYYRIRNHGFSQMIWRLVGSLKGEISADTTERVPSVVEINGFSIFLEGRALSRPSGIVFSASQRRLLLWDIGLVEEIAMQKCPALQIFPRDD